MSPAVPTFQVELMQDELPSPSEPYWLVTLKVPAEKCADGKDLAPFIHTMAHAIARQAEVA